MSLFDLRVKEKRRKQRESADRFENDDVSCELQQLGILEFSLGGGHILTLCLRSLWYSGALELVVGQTSHGCGCFEQLSRLGVGLI